MEYTKPALTFEEQADQLLKRGLQANRDILIARLQAVNYYRLSGYLSPFRNPDDTFSSHTTLDKVWQRYTFDRRLRLLVLDALERVEVSLRTALVYLHAHKYGPFGYTLSVNLPKLDSDQYGKLLTSIYTRTLRSHEEFVVHFKKNYGNSHTYLPLWMVSELMSFGKTVTFFTGVEPAIKREIARTYAIPDEVLSSWVKTLHVVRNICAHHGRLWNRELGHRPKLPRERKYPEWHAPVEIPSDRIFAVLTILKYLIDRIAPQSRWPERLHEVLEDYNEVPKASMGFPFNWKDCPIWSAQRKGALATVNTAVPSGKA